VAHFAKLDDNNIVIEVNVVSDDDCNNLSFPNSEPIGIAFLTQWSGGHSNWRQTSYNTRGGVHYNSETGEPDNKTAVRKNYAAAGYKYDSALDAFVPPQPYFSWTLNQDTCLWEPPIPYPTDGKIYYWDETLQNWIERA
jgi:hypothetical protein